MARVVTNNHIRPIIDAFELSESERREFDYLDWNKIDEGKDSASFVRYKGRLYDLGEFTRDYGITKGMGLPAHLSNWNGYMGESAFSAIVVRYVQPDCDHVIMGQVFS